MWKWKKEKERKEVKEETNHVEIDRRERKGETEKKEHVERERGERKWEEEVFPSNKLVATFNRGRHHA